MAFCVGATVLRDATGNTTDLITSAWNETVNNITIPSYGAIFECNGNCSFGTQNNVHVRHFSKNLIKKYIHFYYLKFSNKITHDFGSIYTRNLETVYVIKIKIFRKIRDKIISNNNF